MREVEVLKRLPESPALVRLVGNGQNPQHGLEEVIKIEARPLPIKEAVILKPLRVSLALVRQDKGQRRFKDPLALLVKNEVGVALVHKAEILLAAGPTVHRVPLEVVPQRRARNHGVKLPAANPPLVAEPLLLRPVKLVSLRAVVAERGAPLLLQKQGKVRAQVVAELEVPAVVKVERVGDSKPFKMKIGRPERLFQGSLPSYGRKDLD